MLNKGEIKKEVSRKTKMSLKDIYLFLDLVKFSMKQSVKKVISIENNIKKEYIVKKNGIGILNTKYGKFYQYNISINDKWEKYSVIVKAELDKKSLLPIFKNKKQIALRIDSGCETKVFGDLTCECDEQLKLAMKKISEIGEGIIINIPFQDARGYGLPFKLASLWLQDELKISTVEAATLLAGEVIDIRTYSGIICILKLFNIKKDYQINLLTNNPKK
ncbi:MAG: hypothetical protein WCW04_03565 [Candidatus Paceibacterota bacterium]